MWLLVIVYSSSCGCVVPLLLAWLQLSVISCPGGQMSQVMVWLLVIVVVVMFIVVVVVSIVVLFVVACDCSCGCSCLHDCLFVWLC